MIILDENESKKFSRKLEKMLNGLMKYNIETIPIMQMEYKKDGSINPVIMSTLYPFDMFTFLKKMSSTNQINNAINNIDRDLLKTKRDINTHFPVVISSFEPVNFYEGRFSDTYFVIIDLLKKFLKDNIIYKIDDEFNFYNENGDKYDIDSFSYKNNIEEKYLMNDIIGSKIPKAILPFKESIQTSFSPVQVKSLALLQKSLDSGVIGDVIELQSSEFDNMMYMLKEEGSYKLIGNNQEIYPDIVKLKPRKLYSIAKTTDKNTIEACVYLQNTDYSLYIMYTYLNNNGL